MSEGTFCRVEVHIYINLGVPQESILGPTLFLVFINDLPLHLEYCDIDLFADDATFHANGKKSELNLNNKPMAIILSLGQNITKCRYITIKLHA